MSAPRLTSSGLIYTQSSDDKWVVAIGGNKTKVVERYSVTRHFWEPVPSFKEAVEADPTGLNNYLFTYAFCSTNMI